ncbi:MAG: cation:proton antiporter [Pseudomonadota bacterium]
MAGATNVEHYKDALIILTTAAVMVPMARHFRLSPVIAYLVAGFVLGPSGIVLLAPPDSWFKWITIAPDNQLGFIGELGVVFLLFLIGLELSFQRLVTMRRLVFGLGNAQILLSAAVITSFCWLIGLPAAAAVLIGLSLALSSTAIVIELLSQQQRLATNTGRTAFSILLMQDLAVIPLIFLVSILAGNSDVGVIEGLLTALSQAALALLAVGGIGWLALRPLFRLVTASSSQELFVAATLLVIVASGLVTGVAGLSMALGAFVAGLLLAETEFRRSIQSAIEPVKGLLLGVFFFTVGMSLDTRTVLADPATVLLGTTGLIVAKALVITVLLMVFRITPSSISEIVGLLASGGEFTFIVIGMATVSGIIEPALSAVIFAITALSMLLIPVLDYIGQRIARQLRATRKSEPELLASPHGHETPPRAVIIGFGRVGRLLSEMLEAHNVPHLAMEHNPENVTAGRKRGRPVYYGDARDDNFLRESGITTADAVLVTINSPSLIEDVVQHVRTVNPSVLVVARARDAEHAKRLYELGATHAVPETIEASLQLAEASLVDLGVPTDHVIASINAKRDEIHEQLQGAGGKGGYVGQAAARSPLQKVMDQE